MVFRVEMFKKFMKSQKKIQKYGSNITAYFVILSLLKLGSTRRDNIGN